MHQLAYAFWGSNGIMETTVKIKYWLPGFAGWPVFICRTSCLSLSTLGKFFIRRQFEIFFLFFPENIIWHFMQIVSDFSYVSQKTEFDISCKLSPVETICMKCQILSSGKNKKIGDNLSSAELAQRVVNVKPVSNKQTHYYAIWNRMASMQ